MLENWPPTLAPKQLDSLVRHAVDWSTAHGHLVMAAGATATTATTTTTTTTTTTPTPTPTNTMAPLAHHVAFALFPSPFDRKSFERAYQLQPIFNTLVHTVCQDEQFLRDTFEGYFLSDSSD